MYGWIELTSKRPLSGQNAFQDHLTPGEHCFDLLIPLSSYLLKGVTLV